MEIRNILPIKRINKDIPSEYNSDSEYLIVKFLRILVAIIFLISGFLKAISLGATSDLISQYFDLLNIPGNRVLSYSSGVLICYFEILLGLFALSKVLYRKLLPIYFVTTLGFTCITIINISSPFGGIQSCGCFGELIILSPLETLLKNILIVGIIIYTTIVYHSTASTKKLAKRKFVKYVKICLTLAVLPISISLLLDGKIYRSFFLALYACGCIFALGVVSYKSTKYKLFTIITFLSLFFSGCHNKTEKVFEMAGDNREELEKVMKHFKHDPDPLKLKAAEFLIENMPYHYSFEGKGIERYDSAYLVMAGFPYQKRDSVFSALSRNFDFSDSKGLPDVLSLKAEFLIKAIDDACASWHKSSWCRDYSEDIFFDYVLPYRLSNEQISDWHDAIDTEFPYLKSNYITSRRGLYLEAENVSHRNGRVLDFSDASQGKLLLLEKKDDAVDFTVNTPIESEKQIWLNIIQVLPLL